MNGRLGLRSGLVVGLLLGLAPAVLAACGEVNVGHLSWSASRIVAAIQGRILKDGFGCDVRLVELVEQPVLDGVLERGEPDLIVGVWLHEIAGDARRAVIDGELVALGDLFAGGSREGWWLPEYFAGSYTAIRSVADVKASFQFFVEAGNEKGTFHNCPRSWACRVINDNLFEAYGLNEVFENVYAQSGEALRESIEAAAKLQMPWFGYYWAPNAVLGAHPMVMVEMNPLDAAGFRCNADERCGTPHAGSYPGWRVLTLGRRAFVTAHADEVAFIRAGGIPEAEMNRLLALYETPGETLASVVDSFFETQALLWSSWVPEVVPQVLAPAP